MIKMLPMAVFALALAGCSGEPVTVDQLSRKGTDGVAIDGYSPVSYFSEGASEKGSPEFAVTHEGMTYWLTDSNQVAAFEADPDRYQPAHGGWCSLMLSGSGQMTPANPESFKIVDDRLLLFWAGEFNGMAIDGRRNWESKFEDATGEQALLARSDKTWSDLLAGGSQNVVLFSESDATRISAERLQRAVTKY